MDDRLAMLRAEQAAAVAAAGTVAAEAADAANAAVAALDAAERDDFFKEQALRKPAKLAGTTTVQRLRSAFSQFAVHDSLSATQLKAILQRQAGGGTSMSDADVATLISNFDYNGDGVLQLQEFLDAMSSVASPLKRAP